MGNVSSMARPMPPMHSRRPLRCAAMAIRASSGDAMSANRFPAPRLNARSLSPTWRQSIPGISTIFSTSSAASRCSSSGTTFARVPFDVIRQPFADMQAQTDATERAAREVGADIRTRLAAYFATQQSKT